MPTTDFEIMKSRTIERLRGASPVETQESVNKYLMPGEI